MEKMIEMQKKRKEEKPVAMLIKGGMLFKDGKTTEEKRVDNDDGCQGCKTTISSHKTVSSFFAKHFHNLLFSSG